MAPEATKLKPQKLDKRPAEVFTQFHNNARYSKPGGAYLICRFILIPFVSIYWRLDTWGQYNVPKTGGAIIAPSHMSNWDHFFLAAQLRRKVQFMAKSNMFKSVLGSFISNGGCFPVRRKQGDGEAMLTARIILEDGRLVVIYPEGGRYRGGKRTAYSGIARLALETGVPIVPVGIINSDKVRPWYRFPPAKLPVLYGEPLYFKQLEYYASEEERVEHQREIAALVLGKILHLEYRVHEMSRLGLLPRTGAQNFRLAALMALVATAAINFFGLV